MNVLSFDDKTSRQSHEVALAYATRADFQRIFTEDMGSLHLLALLLTADATKAEQVFVAGLEDSIHGNPVFREWARTWSKRVIIRNAIKLLSPSPVEPENSSPTGSTRAVSEKDAWTATVMQLPAFDRFVFVILVLEGYSESDCASLLGCSMHAMLRARSRALKRVVASGANEGAARNPVSPQAQIYPGA